MQAEDAKDHEMRKKIETIFESQVAEEVANATILRAQARAQRAAEEARTKVQERSGTEHFVKLLRKCPTPQRLQGQGRQSKDNNKAECKKTYKETCKAECRMKRGAKCKAITRMICKAECKEECKAAREGRHKAEQEAVCRATCKKANMKASKVECRAVWRKVRREACRA